MKKDIHPVSKDIKVTCSCGQVFEVPSTLGDDTRIEICSHCHPFYTGEQRILKTGAVDKFYARQKKMEEMQKGGKKTETKKPAAKKTAPKKEAKEETPAKTEEK